MKAPFSTHTTHIRNPESLPSTCRLGKLQRRANIHRYANFTLIGLLPDKY
jgi:hypothetical protein